MEAQTRRHYQWAWLLIQKKQASAEARRVCHFVVNQPKDNGRKASVRGEKLHLSKSAVQRSKCAGFNKVALEDESP